MRVQVFESLVNDIQTSRGVTIWSLLDRLIESNSVEFDAESQKVRLLNWKYFYFENENALKSLEIGLANVGNLLETLVHNLTRGLPTGELFYERAVWTQRLRASNLLKLRTMVRSHLTAAEQGAIAIIREFEEDELHEELITSGVCMFYFEENPSAL